MKHWNIFLGVLLFFSIFENSCCVAIDSSAKVPFHSADLLFTGSVSSKKVITSTAELQVQRNYEEDSCTSNAECVAAFGQYWTCNRKTGLCECENWSASESECNAVKLMSTGTIIAISIIITVIIIASILSICFRCAYCYGYSYIERRRIEAQVVFVLALEESAQQEYPIQAPPPSSYPSATAPTLS